MRLQEEKEYWDSVAQDPEVDIKYICDINTEDCLKALGKLDGKVLEIGCGVGRLLPKGGSGVDISSKMLAIAQDRRPDCLFIKCDGRSIPFTDNNFDTVYCVLLFQHLPMEGVIMYLSEAARVLRSDGKFIFQFIEGNEDEPFSKHHNLESIKEILKQSFKEIQITHELVHKQWTWVSAIKI